jgi:hypothetical protein
MLLIDSPRFRARGDATWVRGGALAAQDDQTQAKPIVDTLGGICRIGVTFKAGEDSSGFLAGKAIRTLMTAKNSSKITQFRASKTATK